MLEIEKELRSILETDLINDEFTFKREKITTIVAILFSYENRMTDIADICNEKEPDIAVKGIKRILAI
jgi:hypothetical protein